MFTIPVPLPIVLLAVLAISLFAVIVVRAHSEEWKEVNGDGGSGNGNGVHEHCHQQTYQDVCKELMNDMCESLPLPRPRFVTREEFAAFREDVRTRLKELEARVDWRKE